jgi:hypothetical protein
MATSLDVLAIDDTDEQLTYEQLKLIGKGSSYDKRCEFEATIRDVAEQTQRHFQQRIVDMDSNQHSPTFNGGFDAVVHLYRSHLSAPNNGS